MPFYMYQMTKGRRHKSKLQLAHNNWPTHAHHLLCKCIAADMQAHNSCCATGETNKLRADALNILFVNICVVQL